MCVTLLRFHFDHFNVTLTYFFSIEKLVISKDIFVFHYIIVCVSAAVLILS